MKLKEGFVTHEVCGEQLLLAVGDAHFSGLVRSNPTAAMIVDALKEGTTAGAITGMLFERYDAPRKKIAADVEKILDTLRQIGALDE